MTDKWFTSAKPLDDTKYSRLELTDRRNEWRIVVRYDGCFEIWRSYNGVPIDEATKEGGFYDQLHVCELDVLLEMLHEMKAVAMERWPEWWHD